MALAIEDGSRFGKVVPSGLPLPAAPRSLEQDESEATQLGYSVSAFFSSWDSTSAKTCSVDTEAARKTTTKISIDFVRRPINMLEYFIINSPLATSAMLQMQPQIYSQSHWHFCIANPTLDYPDPSTVLE